MSMLKTYSHIERRFVRNDIGDIKGIEPVSVSERMIYSDGEMSVPFGYDTKTSDEEDVQKMLNEYPSFISKLFRNAISYFSHLVWRKGNE
jgi:hypothetical protein